MKHLFLIVCLTFGFYCGSAHAGGVGSGGGNVQLGDQVSTFKLLKAVAEAKPLLLIWLNKQVMAYRDLQAIDQCGPGSWSEKKCTLYGKLFDSKPSIFEVIQDTKIETKMSSPCLDFDGKPTDGSKFGRQPHSICISISNIQQKLVEDNYQNQIAALLAHETSHLMGTTEDEANFLQETILRSDLSYVPAGSATMQMYWTAGSIYNVSNLLFNLKFDEHRAFNYYSGFCAPLNTIVDMFYELDKGPIRDSHYVYLTPGSFGLLWGNSIKLRALRDYTCSQDEDIDANTRAKNLALYNYMFREKNILSAPEYYGSYDREASAEVSIQKIVDIPSWDKELADLSDQVDQIYSSYKTFIQTYFVTYETP